MTTRYEVIKAKTKEEALAKSQWQTGGLARCIQVEAVANSNGTFSVFPICEPLFCRLLDSSPCDLALCEAPCVNPEERERD